LAAETNEGNLKRAMSLLVRELKGGPRASLELHQAALADSLSDDDLSAAGRYFGLLYNESVVEWPEVDIDPLLEAWLEESNPEEEVAETQPDESVEFELDLDWDGRVVGGVRVVNSCGGCGYRLLDFNFAVEEPEPELPFYWRLSSERPLGELRGHHLWPPKSEAFERLTDEQREKLEQDWNKWHGLSLEVTEITRSGRTDTRDGWTYQGFSLDYVVTCKCGAYRRKGRFSDSVPLWKMRSLLTKQALWRLSEYRLRRAELQEKPTPDESGSE